MIFIIFDRLFFSTQLHGQQFFVRKLSALEQLQLPKFATEIFAKLVEVSSLDFTSLWSSANNSALIFLSLFSGDSEDSAQPCFDKPVEVLDLLGLDEIAQLTVIYDSVFSEESLN